MEAIKQESQARSYAAPAVVYEAALVAHAGTTSIFPNCTASPSDLLDPTKGN